MGALVRQIRSTWTTGGTLENPANWLSWALGARSVSSAGESVTERNAMYSIDFLTGVRIISETIAQLPLVLYERQEPRGKRRARNHPLYGVLADQANEEMTAYTLRETLQAHLLTWGNAYAWIEWDGMDVVGLWPMLPDRTRAFRGPDGAIYYETSIQKQPIPVPSQQRIYAESEVLHIAGLSFDGLRGYSVVDLMREALGLSVAQDKYNGRTLSQNSMPPAIITLQKPLGPDERQRFMQEWREAHQGPDKAWAIGMLAAGMDIKPLGITQRDAQFLELRKFTRATTMGFFRIPPHMVSDTEQAPSGGTGVEARSMDFARFAIQPWATRWEQQINMKLLKRPRDGRYFAEFLMDGLMRPDAGARATYFSQGFGKWLTTNDIRDIENLNPYTTPDDPEGNPADTLLYPGNMGSAEQIVSGDYRTLGPAGDKVTPVNGAPATPPAGPGDQPGAAQTASSGRQNIAAGRRGLIAAQRYALQDIADRVLRREVADLVRRAEKGDPTAAAASVYADHETYIARHMEPALRTYAEAIALDVAREIGREVTVGDSFVRSYAASYARRHTQASLAEVTQLISDGANLREAIAGWPKRAAFIAEHESARAGNAFALAAYRSAELVPIWIAGDDCSACRAKNGQPLSGEHPPLCDGCRCVLVSGLEPTAPNEEGEDMSKRDDRLFEILSRMIERTQELAQASQSDLHTLVEATRKAATTPVVIEEGAVQVRVEPSQVIFPAEAIKVIVEPSPVTVQPATVNVSVPERAITISPAEVHVDSGAIQLNMPEPVDEKFVYDRDGRLIERKRIK